MGSTLRALLFANGTSNLTLDGLQFSHARQTYLEPYETPSGGGYSVFRGAAVEVTNSVNIRVVDCQFSDLGGNGLLLSNFNRNATVAGINNGKENE